MVNHERSTHCLNVFFRGNCVMLAIGILNKMSVWPSSRFILLQTGSFRRLDLIILWTRVAWIVLQNSVHFWKLIKRPLYHHKSTQYNGKKYWSTVVFELTVSSIYNGFHARCWSWWLNLRANTCWYWGPSLFQASSSWRGGRSNYLQLRSNKDPWHNLHF